MVNTSVDTYCNDMDRSGTGPINGMNGFGAHNFHHVNSSRSPNIHTNGLSDDSLAPADNNQGLYASYSSCVTSLPQGQQFQGCYEKRRTYNDCNVTNLTSAYTGNIQIASLNTSTMVNTSLNSHSLPSSPLTVVSVPSPPEQKPCVEELEYRQSQLPHLTVIPSPSNSTSPIMERYYVHSPPNQSYQQMTNEQQMICQNGSCYVQEMSPFSQGQSQSPPITEMPHYTQLQCENPETSVATHFDNSTRPEDGSYPILINPANSVLSVPEDSMRNNIDYSIALDQSQVAEIIGKNRRNFQRFNTNYESMSFSSKVESPQNLSRPIRSSAIQQRLGTKKSGKKLRFAWKTV